MSPTEQSRSRRVGDRSRPPAGVPSFAAPVGSGAVAALLFAFFAAAAVSQEPAPRPVLRETAWVRGSDGNLAKLAVSPDGNRAACAGEDGAIRLLELPSGKTLSTWKPHGSAPWVGFVGSGDRLASGPAAGDEDGDILVFWDAASGKELRREKGCCGTPVLMTGGTLIAPFFSPPSNASLRLFDRDGGLIRSIDLKIKKAAKAVFCELAADPGGKRALAYLDSLSGEVEEDLASEDQGVLAAWDLESGKEIWKLDPPEYVEAFTPDGKAFATLMHESAAESEGKMRFRDAATGAKTAEWSAPNQDVTSMAFLEGGRSLAVGGGGRITLWSFPEARLLADRKVLHEDIQYLETWRKGDFLIAGSATDPRIAVLEAPGLEIVDVLTGHLGPLRGLAMDPKGEILVSADWRGNVRVWRISEERAARTAPPPEIDPVSFLPESAGWKRTHAEAVFWDAECPGAKAVLGSYAGETGEGGEVLVVVVVQPAGEGFDSRHEASRLVLGFSGAEGPCSSLPDLEKLLRQRASAAGVVWVAVSAEEGQEGRLSFWASEKRAAAVMVAAGKDDVSGLMNSLLAKFPSSLDDKPPELSGESWAKEEVRKAAGLLKSPEAATLDRAVLRLRRITGRPFGGFRLGRAGDPQRAVMLEIETWVADNLATLKWDPERRVLR
jgi:WD40 repeat protein